MAEFNISGVNVDCTLNKGTRSGNWFVVTDVPGCLLESKDFTDEQEAKYLHDYLCAVFSAMENSVKSYEQWGS